MFNLTTWDHMFHTTSFHVSASGFPDFQTVPSHGGTPKSSKSRPFSKKKQKKKTLKPMVFADPPFLKTSISGTDPLWVKSFYTTLPRETPLLSAAHPRPWESKKMDAQWSSYLQLMIAASFDQHICSMFKTAKKQSMVSWNHEKSRKTQKFTGWQSPSLFKKENNNRRWWNPTVSQTHPVSPGVPGAK